MGAPTLILYHKKPNMCMDAGFKTPSILIILSLVQSVKTCYNAKPYYKPRGFNFFGGLFWLNRII